MVDDKLIPVQVVYAMPDEQWLHDLEVPADATVEEVIRQSGVLQHFPEIELGKNKIGVFGKLTTLKATLNPGDRVEIYRPLIADPKEARKKRAAKGKVMRKGARAQSATD